MTALPLADAARYGRIALAAAVAAVTLFLSAIAVNGNGSIVLLVLSAVFVFIGLIVGVLGWSSTAGRIALGVIGAGIGALVVWITFVVLTLPPGLFD